ncbi:phage tail protein [Klebsiella michiganensis]|uniref:phage tail protein n=1 Tax=Klebsiella michiganensis TaxID=1134687 RepID=UPI001CCB64DC|nr:phage tail protein [Klebsiella michiganensis]MBZ7211166.1 phage tail protein [Klebsiella michiganensis]
MSVTEEMLIDYDLLRPTARQWRYRYSVGSGWLSASSKESAIEGATEAYLKASPDELLTRDQRFEKADREEIERSESMWGHMPIAELLNMFEKMGGDISSLRNSSALEFNGNGGRSTSRAVSAQGARDTAETRMKLLRYIEWRQERAA